MPVRKQSLNWILMGFVIFLTTNYVKSGFLFRPVNQKVAPGTFFHQACATFSEPLFAEWHHNQRKIGSCLFSTNTTSTTTGSSKFKFFIGRQQKYPVCHLSVTGVAFEQTGEYTCKTVQANSDTESATAVVLVHRPVQDLHLRVFNQTTLAVDQEAKIECISTGGNPSPKLRLSLGGSHVSAVEFVQKPNYQGVTVSNLTAKVRLQNKHHWNVLACHVDMGSYRSVNQTFTILHLIGYRSLGN
ncbi:hypothetical protein CSKR_109837 [Clonorchis sinensis]|uniref:Uncharacterized protein n=2 Tax=Clonorchis sinensis TaxID=79923 RepID=A0A8T1MDV5_CLOSI|nr:hypothetical protein CSKR_109837 [Clonorchis sinensis]GAA54524.1 hypothetical protein CLF_103557 [Clonorchis sinensis]